MYVTEPMKIKHMNELELPSFSTLLYHNICKNVTKRLPLMANLMGILLHFTEMGY